MRLQKVMQLAGCLFVATSFVVSVNAQEPDISVVSSSADLRGLSVVPSRVVERIDESRRVTLTGNTHPMARLSLERGTVDPQLPLERMQLILRRSPDQEAALDAFMAEQLDPKSANFHHWLHAEEFGKIYGPSDSDIASVTSWLQNHGFRVDEVSKGRVTIEFSGTASQVQEAFHTEIHNYLVGGKIHIANDRDPEIPEALAPVIIGIASLHDFFPKHQSVLGRFVTKNAKTGKVTPVESIPEGPKPSYVFTDPNNGIPNEDIGPYDFAAIYNLTPLWNEGIAGKGQTIAIASQTDINLNDIATFRKFFGLNKFAGTVKQVINGADPGIIQGSLTENTLDTEWSGATAPDADVITVSSKGTATTAGGNLSISYIIDHEVAHVMSASYGECEAGLGKAGNAGLNAIFQQGSAEGISLFESAGDQGSTGCDNSDATSFPAPAEHGLQVNGFVSNPYITGVGGTDIVWQEKAYAQYWTKNTANNSSAIGYIPEIPWNSTCTNYYLLTYVYTGQKSYEELCNNAYSAGLDDMIRVVGGSGGKSSCLSNTGTFASCSGAYPKPAWQKGIGVPGDAVRDVPDVSFFASSGLPSGNGGSAYLICVSSSSPDNTCDYTGDNITAQEVGGTSVSSPAMAGIMALVLQKTGKAQGLANPVFYELAAKESLANCNSNTVANGNSCIFYDITSGNNAMPCSTGSINCVTQTSGDTFGIVSGYNSTTGYDLATGLGSMNVTNLVNAWPSTTTTPSVTVSPGTVAFPATTVNITSTSKGTVTVKNTGTAALSFSKVALSGTDASSFAASTNCPTGSTLAAGASCTVTLTFRPLAAGSLAGTLDVTDGAGTQTVGVSGSGVAVTTETVSVSPTSLTFAATKLGATTAAQTVTIKNTGTGAVTLSSGTVTGTNASSFVKSASNCGSSLAVGASCTVSVEFKPNIAGSLVGSLSIADNASGSPQLVSLKGTGLASALTVSVSPASLTFAATKLGSYTATQTVTVKNTSASVLTLGAIGFTGTDASSFVKPGTNCGSSLAAGASCMVSVLFKPAVAGSLSASLSVADDATGSPQVVALKGTGIASALTVSVTPASLTFAATKVGTAAPAQVVTLKNTGTGAVTLSSGTVTGTDASSFLKPASTCGSSLAAGASCTVSIEFKPTLAGSLSASLAIADNAAGSPQLVALKGTGTATASMTVGISPTLLTFPATDLGKATASQLVTVKNTGTGAIAFTSTGFTGTNPKSFIKSGTTCGSSLASGASCTISIEFTPMLTGALSAYLNIVDNATGSPQLVALKGTGLASSSPTITLGPTSIAFPNTIAGKTSDAVAVTLTNTGTAAVTLNSIAVSGASFLDLTDCGASLGAKAYCQVYVAFKPAAAGGQTGSLIVTDNAAGSPQKVTLSGTGTAAPSVKLSTTAINFPATVHGTTSEDVAVTLTNAGTATLTLTSISLTGANPADFEMLDTCGATLAPGSYCAVYLAFKPAAAAAYKAVLSVVDDGGASPQSIVLAGTGK